MAGISKLMPGQIVFERRLQKMGITTMFNPALDGQGKVEPLKQHRQAIRELVGAPKNTALADAMKKAVEKQPAKSGNCQEQRKRR